MRVARCGVDVCELPAAGDRHSIARMAAASGRMVWTCGHCELGRRGIIQLMVEGGGALRILPGGRLASQLRLYVGATALGSTSRR